MLKSDVRAIALASLGTLAIACSGAPAGTGAPTLPPISIPPLPSLELPSFPPATELEALFPDEIAGNPLEVTSARGEDVVDQFSSSDPQGFRDLIAGLGASMEQVNAATSFNLWPGATEGDATGLSITALQIQGIPAASTLAALQSFVEEQDVENAQVSQQTVGGKSVTAVVSSEDAEDAVYLYAVGDVVFLIGGTPAHVEEALSELP